ncbi:MAG: MIP/aquaporin family protein [Planctomycetaceae bacterium]
MPSQEAASRPDTDHSMVRQVVAEVIGTFLLVFFGLGAVHAAVLTGAQQGLWQVAIVWGVAIMLAIYSVGGISGAHINPAMTLAFAVWRGFPKARVLPFIAGQLAGAMLAAGVLFVIFHGQLAAKEREKNVQRGQPGSVVTAMCYGEYFPNPGGLAAGSEPYWPEKHDELQQRSSPSLAFAAELIGTLILSFVVFALTDERNRGQPAVGQAPIFIGLTVAALISVIAPLTQACFNPARDFGPRVFASLAGWGSVALPGQDSLSWLTVYIVAPIAGAIMGGGFYEFAIGRFSEHH